MFVVWCDMCDVCTVSVTYVAVCDVYVVSVVCIVRYCMVGLLCECPQCCGVSVQ